MLSFPCISATPLIFNKSLSVPEYICAKGIGSEVGNPDLKLKRDTTSLSLPITDSYFRTTKLVVFKSKLSFP